MHNSVRNNNLIGFLVGVLLFSLAMFRAKWFWEQPIYVGWLYLPVITMSCILTFYFGAKLLGFRGRNGLFLLTGIEVFSILFVSFVVHFQLHTIADKVVRKMYDGFRISMGHLLTISQYDNEVEYLYIPNHAGIYQNWEFNTTVYSNSAGLRDDEASLINPAIITLGDSYTTGWGLEQQESYPQLIEKQLGKKVLNAGIASFGTVRESALLNSLDKDSCQWLIVQYCQNDALENKTWADSLLKGYSFKTSLSEKKYNLIAQNGTFSAHYTPFKFVFLGINAIMQKSALYIHLRPQNQREVEGNINNIPEQVAYYLKVLRYIRKTYKGNILTICLPRNAKNLDIHFIKEAQKQYLQTGLNDVYFLDLSPVLTKSDAFLMDGHHNKQGNQKIAAQIVQFLKDFEKRSAQP